MKQAIVTLDGQPQSVAIARHLALDFIGSNHPQASLVELLVSELATNAIQHTNSCYGSFCMAVTVYEDSVRVDVLDEGSTDQPVVKYQPTSSLCGRGLYLVEVLATYWQAVPGPLVGQVSFEVGSPL
jgi:anti-sigma regulatory factor (Ser/Thr protein kinase)